MLAVAYYLLKVTICSGILYAYYRLALHNKLFHRWNRFYLLSAVIVSLIFPLIKINIAHTPSDNSSQVIKLWNVVTTGDEIIIDANGTGKPFVSSEILITGMYVLVSLFLLSILIYTVYKLNRLIKKNASQFVYGIRLVNSDAKGTPFSFFKNIFWNNNIDIDSATGEKIFRHELAHVQEKHSADRLFINIILILFWCNPFFWLIRREMNMIHEFIADSKAVEDNDTSALAAMIIQAAYPQQNFGLTSSFFSSSIKRRILMLTKMQNPNVNYISRVLVLPLLTFVFLAFTIKTKHVAYTETNAANIALNKNITVVIDAGHGGNEPGAYTPDGKKEKDITLAIAKKIQQLNTNPGVKILLTRETDIFQNVREKVEWTVKQKPDAFISIHVSADPEKIRSGFEIYVSKNENQAKSETRALASIVSQEIKNTYNISKEFLQRAEKGIWVLDAPDITYPAMLIECGYLTNKKDLAFITNASNQEKIAQNILDAIAKYADAKQNGTAIQIAPVEQNSISSTNSFSAKADTVPKKIKSIDFTKDDNVIIIYADNKAVKMTKKEAVDKGIINNDLRSITQVSSLIKTSDPEEYRLRNKKVMPEDLNTTELPGVTIVSTSLQKDMLSPETKKTGETLTVKDVEMWELSDVSLSQKNSQNNNNEIEVREVVIAEGDKIFSTPDVQAKFPGGDYAWTKYISKQINNHLDAMLKAGNTGTCLVQFIVDTEGNISEVKALTMENTKFAEIVIDAITNGPKWIPALQDGKKIKSYRKQPVTFQMTN